MAENTRTEAERDRALAKSSSQRKSPLLNILIASTCALTIAPIAVGIIGSPTGPAHAAADTRVSVIGMPCILESIEYDTHVSGYLATVNVRQRFLNPNTEKMNATYTFPLSDRAAIDQMTMKIGNRNLQSVLKESKEAKAIYEAAKRNGQSAALLEEYRPNIFTQSVANIEPGQSIEINTRYTEELPFSQGNYSLVLPTEVGPRFIPDNCNFDPMIASGSQGINNKECLLSVNLNLNEGGIPISRISSPTHPISISQSDPSHAKVSIPSNCRLGKDIVVDWQVSSEESIQSGYLTHKKGSEGFLTAMIVPPKTISKKNTAPKEMIFVVDCSGSQSGQPLDKAKETLHYILDHMNPQDSFQIFKFADNVSTFAPAPVLINKKNKEQAHAFVQQIIAGGGTQMAPAIESACSVPSSNGKLRIITLMTDGFIGNDHEVIGMVKRLRGKSRWFPFGTGNSVNRSLINDIAKEGGGEAEFVLGNSSSQEVGKHFYDRISSPVLTNVTVSFEGISPSEIYPKQISDVWEQKPLYVQAKYNKAGKGAMIVKGYVGGKAYSSRLPISLSASESRNSSLPRLYGRAKIDQLYSNSWDATPGDRFVQESFEKNVVEASLKYNVLSEFTSFVAVDNKVSLIGLDELTNPNSIQHLTDAIFSFQLPTASMDPILAIMDLPRQIQKSVTDAIETSNITITSQLNRLNSVAAPTQTIPLNLSRASSVSGNSSMPSSNATPVVTSPLGQSSGSGSPQSSYINGSIPSQTSPSTTQIAYSAPLQAMNSNGTIFVSRPGSRMASRAMDANLFGPTEHAMPLVIMLVNNLVALAQYAWMLLAAYLFVGAKNKNLSTIKRRALMCTCTALLFIALNVPNTLHGMIDGLI